MSQNKQIQPQIEESWLKVLQNEFEKPYFKDLKVFLTEQKKTKTIFPPVSQLFEAFNQTPFTNLKVVILGQDPYHGKGQAHGLCFSVNKGIPMPPSLKNIFKEMKDDLGIEQPAHGDLTEWAQQGVFLLNATLSVEESKPGSHQGQGWEIFTNEVIRAISNLKEHVVFILWGKFAQQKAELINSDKHLVLKAAHPSPFSAYNGFFGSKPFSQCNNYLSKHKISPINWQRK